MERVKENGKTVSVQLSAEELFRLARVATRQGVSLSEVIDRNTRARSIIGRIRATLTAILPHSKNSH